MHAGRQETVRARSPVGGALKNNDETASRQQPSMVPRQGMGTPPSVAPIQRTGRTPRHSPRAT